MAEQKLIVITFDEYDRLDEEAEEIEIEEFPSVEEIQKEFDNWEGDLNEWLKWVLAILQCTPDKAYKKEINLMLSGVLYLADGEEVKKNGKAKKDTVKKEDLEEIAKKVSEMEYQCDYFYPSVDDLKNYPFSCQEEDVAYLLWLIRAEVNLTDEEEKARTFAKRKLQEILASC